MLHYDLCGSVIPADARPHQAEVGAALAALPSAKRGDFCFDHIMDPQGLQATKNPAKNKSWLGCPPFEMRNWAPRTSLNGARG